MLLELEDVHVHYGKVEALKGISVTVAEGEIVTLIGANGAGKTTTLKTISGVRPVTSGTHPVRRRGHHGHGRAASSSTAACSRPPRAAGSSPGMTVLENLEMGAYARKGKDTASDLERVYELFPRLLERRAQAGGTLSGGEQQMLAIGRALMGQPEAAAARRAVDGPGPEARGPDLLDHHRDQRPGHHDPARRAERHPGPAAGRTGPTCSRSGAW